MPALVIEYRHESISDATTRISKQLATGRSPVELMQCVARVSGFWQQVCTLGVHDDGLWTAIHFAWDVLLGGLSMIGYMVDKLLVGCIIVS